MRKSAKLITALSVAGLAVAAGSAFTGAGLATTGQANSAQFVGGTVTQSVTGANLNSIVYGYSNAPANTLVNQVTLTFADDKADAKIPTISLDGAASITCLAIDTSHISVCNVATPVGVDSIAVTVPS
jgi:hypothetical protein